MPWGEFISSRAQLPAKHLHPEQQGTLSSHCTSALPAPCPRHCPVPGEEIASKSLLWDMPGWRKDLRVLMDPGGNFGHSLFLS